ncbi:unnamed protein product, partial [Coregonus sp. 'balchen']
DSPGDGDRSVCEPRARRIGSPCRSDVSEESSPKTEITQIALSVFHISSVIVIDTTGMSMWVQDLPQIIGSLFVIIAGSLAIAAQNLHLPTLKASLGM